MTAVEALLILASLAASVGLVIALAARGWARRRLHEAPGLVSGIHAAFAVAPLAWLALFALLVAYASWDVGGFAPLHPRGLRTYRWLAVPLLLALPALAFLVPVHAGLAGVLWQRDHGRDRPLTAVFAIGIAAIVALLGFDPWGLRSWWLD